MKHLLYFSLRRRFVNRMMLFFVVIMTLLVLLIGFVDQLVLSFNPKLNETIRIKLEKFDQQLFVDEADYPFILDEFARIRLEQHDNYYLIKSPDAIEPAVQEQIKLSISKYHFQRQYQALPKEQQNSFKALSEVDIRDEFLALDDHAQKHHLAFYGITVVYFMMISFAAMISQEIIAEKQSNILELIGTSVPLKVHYYSKILGGWLSVLIQVGLLASIVVFVVLLRIVFDNGSGWLQFMRQLNLFTFEFNSITEGLSLLLSKTSLLGIVFVSFLYLFLGILTLQIFLVRLTLKVKNIEEAASIQSPVYIVLLFMYYGAMFLNNPNSMQSGLAMYLSFFPFFSMIFMPARILLYAVGWFQLLVSLVLSLTCFLYILISTRDLYESHILVGFQD